MASAWADHSASAQVDPAAPVVLVQADPVVLPDSPEPMAHPALVTTALPRPSLAAPADPVADRAVEAASAVVVDEVAVDSVAAVDVAAVAVAPHSAPMVTPNSEIASIED